MLKKIIAGYIRVASVRQKDTAQVGKQKRLLNRMAKKYELKIDRFYIDVGYDGMTLKRPELNRLLKECKAERVSTVLVTDLDRIARYADLVLTVLRRLKRYKVRVVANEGYGFVE